MTAPAITATTASSQFSDGFAADRATDRTFNTAWIASTSTGWIRLQLASAYAATGYRIISNTNEPNRAPKTWTCEGSNDGTSWTVLDTRTNQPAWSSTRELRSYTFTNSTAYTYYRLNVSANNGDGLLGILELYPDPAPPLDTISDEYAKAVSQDSPAVWVRHLETSGAVSEDFSGSGAQARWDGTYTRNATGLITSSANPSITTSNAGGRIPCLANNSPTAAITLEAIIHSTSLVGYNTIFSRDDESGSRCYQFRVTPTGQLEMVWWSTAAAGPYFCTSAASTVVVNTTYHVAAVYDGTTMRLYVDGSQVASTTQSGGIRNAIPASGAIYVARHVSSYPFVGRSSDHAVYATALSAARVAAHAAAVTAAGGVSVAPPAATSTAAAHTPTVDLGALNIAAPIATAAAAALAATITIGGLVITPPAATATTQAPAPTVTVYTTAIAAPTATAAAAAPTPTVLLVTGDVIAPPAATATATATGPDVTGVFIEGIDTHPLRSALRLGVLTIPTAVPPPLGTNAVPVVRYSHVAPALSASQTTLTPGVDYPRPLPVEVGVEHVFVDGVDATYLGGTPIQSLRRSSTSPAGDVAATFEIASMHPWEKAGEGRFAALRPDAPVEVALVRDDGTRVHLWGGFISADQASVGEAKRNGFTADGTLWQAGYTLNEPPHYMPPTDIGTVIPDLLNSVPGKRWGDVPRVVTGRMTRQRGSGNQSVMQRINDILARDGWTDDMRQWTLVEPALGEIRLELKSPMTAADAVVTYGAPGVEVNLSREQSQRVDVIYGKGTTAGGGQWRGTRFPGLVLATPPPYPNDPPNSMHLGETDAMTDSGTGVSDWQRRMVELGYTLTVDGVLNANDIDVVRRLQGMMGALVDGVIGPQTWAASFNRGPEGIDLTQWREPIAALDWTQQHYRDPAGIILADNPTFAGESRVQHHVEVDFGVPITWREAQPLAQRMLAVESEPALTGTITLVTDPHDCWRGEIRPGWRVQVLGFQGEDVLVRVAAVDAQERMVDGKKALVVELTVDERTRDALSVEAILERNRDALPDPARRPGNPNRDSRNERDRFVQWDIDSPCGFMPRTAVFGGLWVAPNPIPFAEVGRVVKVMLTSTVPFSLALFGLPVKPSQMHAIVGDPLASTDPYRPHTEALDALGWIEAWGSQGDRCGYSPGQEADYPFSGEFVEMGGFDFISGHPPYVWPLLYSATTGFIGGGSGEWGRFYPDTAA